MAQKISQLQLNADSAGMGEHRGKGGKYEPPKFSESFGKGSLKYPSNLSTEELYPDAICFTIMKRVGVSIQDVSGAASEAAGFVKKALVDGTGIGKNNETSWMNEQDAKELNQIMNNPDISDQNKKEQASAKAAVLWKAKNKGDPPENLFETMMGGLANFAKAIGGAQLAAGKARKARRELETMRGSKDILGSIYMNMPAGITFTDKANWAGDSLGAVGKLVKDVVGGSGDAGATVAGAVTGSAGNIAGAAVGGIGTLVARMGLKGGLVGMAVGAAAGGSVLQKGAEAALGVSMNPYMEMMFSGIGFRDFQFDFNMRPRNETELEEIHNIITALRTHTRPSWVGGTLGKSFMEYPMEFSIEFLTTGGKGDAEQYSPNPYVPKLKTCVCDSVTTNYSPQNMWTAHRNGAPVAITLGLHFQETELVMAQDVLDDKF